MEIEHGQKRIYLDSASSLGSPSCHQDDDMRPSKRQSNRFTMTRIAAYPRIKVLNM